MSQVEAEIELNNPDGSLPFAYVNPETEGKLTWICNRDAEGKITSVFCFDNGVSREKQCSYLKDEDDAKKTRDTLIDAGWQKLIPPKVVLNYPGDKGDQPLNRKQKRYIKRKLEQMNRQNPFT
jgi:hypothetical protein